MYGVVIANSAVKDDTHTSHMSMLSNSRKFRMVRSASKACPEIGIVS